MIRSYEMVFIARQDLTSAQVEALVQSYTGIVKEFGGDVTKTEFCGLRNLAYMIKKNKKGHYVLFNISVKPEAIKEIERQMSLNEDILRYLSIRVEELDNTPSPLMQQKSYKDSTRPDDHVEDEILTSVTAGEETNHVS